MDDGYYIETLCQLCGVSFAIARLRTVDEPPEAAWDYIGDTFVNVDEYDDDDIECKSDTGCTFVDREVTSELNSIEHIAGPGCISTAGYNGHRISEQEMEGCRAVQCLARKGDGWQPESDDQDFELESDYFLTGHGDGSPDHEPLRGLEPVRHGAEEIYIGNSPYEDAALPFHPYCFEIFKRVSIAKLGNVDVEGLWCLREIEDFLTESPRDIATLNGNQRQWWNHKAGHEYLAANPVEIPGLASLLKLRSRERKGRESHDCRLRGDTNVQSTTRNPTETQNQRLSQAAAYDPFHKLSNELTGLILDNLQSNDIANLRLASRKFGRLPDILFRRLLFEEMPWFWEGREFFSPRDEVHWFSLYWDVKFEWKHLKGLVNRKRVWKMIEEVVRRIEEYRAQGMIPLSDDEDDEDDDGSDEA